MKSRSFSRLLCAGFVLLLVSCGLDNYIYFNPVTTYLNWPSDTDELKNYFEFMTNDNSNKENPYFKGFEIFYRIYNNSSDRASDASAITSYNSDNPALAYLYLMNTKNYVRMESYSRVGYQPLIPSASTNRTVTIRFTAYEDEPAGIVIDGNAQDLALRTIDSTTKKDNAKYTFVFDEIASGDSDVKYGTWDDTTDKKWYVQAFVLAYGYDEGFKPVYSAVFNIGYLTVRP